LAQYREVEAFASFGSELDEATQHTLVRGVRLIEILNQAPYKPLPLYYQIILIYAATCGFFDRLEVAKVTKFKELLAQRLADANLYQLMVEANKALVGNAVYSLYDQLITYLLTQL
jgi:F-type H+/Na+-transporting ATPase subunit alpha